jgi:hypothetical protein
VASIIQVEPESLTADALDLADSQVPIVPPISLAPAADPVSQGVAAVLEAHSGALTTVVEHSWALRVHGGAVLSRCELLPLSPAAPVLRPWIIGLSNGRRRRRMAIAVRMRSTRSSRCSAGSRRQPPIGKRPPRWTRTVMTPSTRVSDPKSRW